MNRNVRSIGASLLAVAAFAATAGPLVAQAGGKPRPTVLVPVLAPAQGSYSAPAPTATFYSATTYSAPGVVGSAPAAVAGSRIKATDRSDLIEDLKNEAAQNTNKSGPKLERRKSLRESVTTKYAEIVGSEPENLNEYERADIENIVSAVIDGSIQSVGYGPAVNAVGLAPVSGGHHHHQQAQPIVFGAPVAAPSYAPVAAPMLAPVAAPAYAPMSAPWVQPMVPVPVWIPAQQPKHWLFRKHY